MAIVDDTVPLKSREAGAVVPKSAVRYASWVAFLAWAFAVYDYITFGTVLPKISTDFGWSTATSTGITTIVSVGVFFVALTVGPMLDVFGRKRSLIITTVGAACSSGLSAISPFAWFLVIVRFISGLGYSEQAVNATYLNELYAASEDRESRLENKGLAYSLIQGGWPVGALFASLMATLLLPLGGWRVVFAAATFPAVVIAVLGIRLVETPQFLAMQKIRRSGASASRESEPPATQMSSSDPSIASVSATTASVKRSPYLALFERGYRMHTVSLTIAFLLNWCGVLVFDILGTTVLTAANGLTFGSSLVLLIVGNGVAFVGYLVHGYVGDRVGRRETIAAGWVLSAICYGAMLFVVSGFALVLIFYSLGLFFLIGPYAALLFYMSESYPARMRGTGTAVVNAMGPIGAIVGAALLTALLGGGMKMGGAAGIAGAATILLSGIILLGAHHVAPGHMLGEELRSE